MIGFLVRICSSPSSLMNLNDHHTFGELDVGDVLADIQALPGTLGKAYSYGNAFPLPEFITFSRIVLTGMGSSFFASKLFQAYVSPVSPIPVHVINDSVLPKWAQDEETLVILASHSGNTQEVLSICRQAYERSCSILTITTGGKLSKWANEKKFSLWKYAFKGQSGMEIGWTFGLLLNLFEQLNLISSQKAGIDSTVKALEDYRHKIDVDVPIATNPAKRMAGQLVGKYAAIIGAEHLAPVALRWKTLINEFAKSWCYYDSIPEVDHTTLAGTLHPEQLIPNILSIFLQSSNYSTDNQTRVDLTFTEFMVAGMGTDRLNFSYQEELTEVWVAILFGDYMAYYLAMLYNENPSSNEAVESFKMQFGD